MSHFHRVVWVAAYCLQIALTEDGALQLVWPHYPPLLFLVCVAITGIALGWYAAPQFMPR